MAKAIVPLTVLKIAKAKPKEKDYSLFDGNGLYLLIKASGSKLWRFKYRINNTPKLISLGKYPDISLPEARKQHLAAREQVALGVDPAQLRKETKAQVQAAKEYNANTFEKIAREWHENKRPDWTEVYADKILKHLERDVFPIIGNRPIGEITTPEIANLLQKVAIRTLETAHRLKVTIEHAYRYAVIKGICPHNPASSLKGVLPSLKHKHMAAPTTPEKLAEILRATEGFTGSFVVKCALILTPMLFVRPGELRRMEWVEIDFDKALWSIPAAKMKMRKDHLVPLPRQAVETLKSLHPLTGIGEYVFCSLWSRNAPMSVNTINVSLRRLGFSGKEVVPHGFRATARTLLHEVLKFEPDVIEAQLAHAVPDRLGRAYNRTQFIEERTRMMQVWADYLDSLKVVIKKEQPTGCVQSPVGL
ncbi:MAG: integrase arm-type DNA-binding domain-containing protein [Desulfuromonadaceae bacterium]|nr:integrase arm-type DNA-binding domain-containing protein [Desulfuromonadaceae bacterium]